MSKKGNLSLLNRRIVASSKNNRVGVCSVYRMRHSLQGPKGSAYLKRKCIP